MKSAFNRIAFRAFLPVTLIVLISLASFYHAPATTAQADTTAPTIESVAITSDPDARSDGAYELPGGQSTVWASSWYGIGDRITATATFSEPIAVTGSPVLRLTIGTSSRTAAFNSASGTTATFNYTVVEGDTDNDGITIQANRLILSGGTIKDTADNDATLTYDQDLNNSNHKVDGIRPRLQSLRIISIWRYNSSGYDDVFDIGEELFVHATFSEYVLGSIAGPPQINMQMGDESRPANWEAEDLFGYYSMFNYFVQEGDSDLDGLSIAANAVNLNSGFIKDSAGNDAILDHSAITSTWKVDGTKPYITSVAITSDPGPDATYGVGDTIDVTVTFNEHVYASASSNLELDIGGTARQAQSSDDSRIWILPTSNVIFSYTVQDGDGDSDGITIDANKLTKHNSMIMDAVSGWPGGNNANLEHSALPANAGHKVLTTEVAVPPTPTPQNRAATGQPVIIGTAQATHILAVSTSAITDADGLNNATFTYEWIRNDGASDTAISGSTTYVLSEADVGHTIKVKVSFSDDQGHNEAVISNPTSTVAPPPNNVANGSPTITGSTRIGQTLTAVTTGISDQDGLTQVAYTYQWLRNDGTNDSEISGATNATYTLDSNDAGKTIKVKVRFTDDRGHNEVVTSSATATITAAPNNPADGRPTITGTVRVDERLTADTAGISDTDGLTQVAYTYQWVRNDGADDADIIGANYQTYLLTAEDRSQFIKVRVTFSDDAQNAEEITSIATVAVTARVAFLTGLTVSPGTLTPAFDSSTTNYTVPNVSNTDEQVSIVSTVNTGRTAIFVRADAAFQVCAIYHDYCGPWMYQDDNVEVHPISDADTNTPGFQVTIDVGVNHIMLHIASVSSANDEFYYLTITRAEPSQSEELSNSPADGSPTINGTAQVAQTLTANTSGISDADGLANAAYSYQWLSSGDAEIDGATGSTYVLVGSDAGKTIKVRVTFTDDAGNDETLTSVATAAVADGAPTDPPGSPRNLTGTVNPDGTVTLYWDAPNDGTVMGYQILRRRPSEGENTLLVHVNDTESTATDYTDNDVTPDVLHAYRVKAINAVGLSGQSNFVNITPGQPTEPAQNSPATGTPQISGTAQVGQTLTANTTGISDADGLNNAAFSYRWIRNDGSTDTDIQDATGSSYTLVSADAGQTIQVKVTFTDDADNQESLTSAATAAVAPEPNSPATGLPTISGTARVGGTLTADTSAITDADGLNNATFTYEWIRNDGTSDTEISGATSYTYTLSNTDVGKTVKVRVRLTDDRGHNEAVTSSPTSTVVAAPNTAANGAPTITGATRIGQTLTAVTTGISDQDGLTQVAYTYQWLRNDGTNDSEISGATNATYTLDSNDAGKTIKVKVRFTDDRGHNEVVTSSATATITAAPNNPADGRPTITGTVRVDERLTADTAGISDTDGLTQVAYTYQWVRNDGADDADIIGANYQTYLLTAEDRSQFIKVRVTFSDDAQNAEEITSIATVAVTARVAFLTGLTVSPGTLTPAFDSSTTNYTVPNVSNTDEQVSIVSTVNTGRTAIFVRADAAFQVCAIYHDYCGPWMYQDDNVEVHPISDADTNTPGFQVTIDVGVNHIMLHIASVSSANDEFYYLTITRAEPSQSEELSNSPADGSPTINGTAQVAQTLTANTSGISDADGLANAAYSYQWLSSGDAEIDGATGSTYVLVGSDAGKTIKVRVTFTDDAGNDETLTSVATAAVADGAPTDPPGSPRNLTGTVNPDGTVTLYWDAPNDGTVMGYQILRRRPSEGENTLLVHVNDTESTATDYTDNDVTPDVLHAYRVKAINAVGLSGQSNFVNITPGQPTEPAQNSPATGTPQISGTAQVGQTLTANTTGISDADGLTNVGYGYQWVSSGDAEIQGATGANYSLVAADEGKTIKVKVSFTDDVGNEESLTSAATAAVAARPNNPATGAPSVNGTARVGETLTASTSGIADTDGLGDAVFSYQWTANDGSTDSDIQNATGETYTLVDADEGKTIKVKVSFTDDTGNDEILTSAATGEVAIPPPPPNTPATGQPSIAGTAQVGETLTVETSGISDQDGIDNVTFTYQWTAGGANIEGAIRSSYTVADADAGLIIQVKVSFTDDARNSETLTSSPTEAVTSSESGNPTEPPPAPQNLTATVNSDGSVTLAWEAPDDESITGYLILRRRPTKGENTLLVYVTDTKSTAATYTDRNPTAGIQHAYRVKAINAAGTGPVSNFVNVTP